MASTTISHEDEPESDDQGPMLWKSPLNAKPVLKADDMSESTLMTSPCSSSKTQNSIDSSNVSSVIKFSDSNSVLEIDCDYTDEQVNELWFTKEEYDDFLQACDEDAQKCEAHEKEIRVNKIKKEIRRQRRLRRKEEKEKRQQKLSSLEGLDESMNSMAHEWEGDDDIIDDDELDESNLKTYNEDEEGWMCSLGLEAWTLEGYKSREYNRQKAIDSVLNEQYAAWDRGMMENAEMMSALYFAASATSKHDAAKKAKELEIDVGEYTVISTLEDYNKAVKTLNILQKSLNCINNRNKTKDGQLESLFRTKAKRRGSNDSAASISAASSVINRAMAMAENSPDEAPRLPVKPTTPSHVAAGPETASVASSTASSSSWKKYKQRKENNNGPTPKIYKSKAATNIVVAPPTPPVTKKQSVALYKPSRQRPPLGDTGEMPLSDGSRSACRSKSPKRTSSKSPHRTSSKSPHRSKSPKKIVSDYPRDPKSPKSRKIVYKPIVGESPKVDRSVNTRSVKTSKSSTNDTKPSSTKKKKKKRDTSDKESKQHHKGDKSTKSKSSTKDSKESSSATGKLLKKMSPKTKVKKHRSEKIHSKTNSNDNNTERTASVSGHTTSSHRNSHKKEHWWFQQQNQACQ